MICGGRNIETVFCPNIPVFPRQCHSTNAPYLFIHLSPGLYCFSGPGSSVGMETDCGLDGLGSNPGGDEIFRPVQTGPGDHPASCKMGIGSFPGVKCGRGVLLTTHPLLLPRSWKSRAIPLTTLWDLLKCTIRPSNERPLWQPNLVTVNGHTNEYQQVLSLPSFLNENCRKT